MSHLRCSKCKKPCELSSMVQDKHYNWVCRFCLQEQIQQQAEQITELTGQRDYFKKWYEQNKEENQRLKALLNEEAMFEKIWQVTKHWDLDNGRPIEGTDIRGYAGMSGDDVRVIIKALKGE